MENPDKITLATLLSIIRPQPNTNIKIFMTTEDDPDQGFKQTFIYEGDIEHLPDKYNDLAVKELIPYSDNVVIFTEYIKLTVPA